MLKPFLALLVSLMRTLSNRKPRKCRKCGNRQFSVITETSYRAEIDGRTKQIVTDSILAENIVSVKCGRCGKELEPQKLEFAAVTLA